MYIDSKHGTIRYDSEANTSYKWSFKVFEEWKNGFLKKYEEIIGRSFKSDFSDVNQRRQIYKNLTGYNGLDVFGDGTRYSSEINTHISNVLYKISTLVPYIEGKEIPKIDDKENILDFFKDLEISSLREIIKEKKLSVGNLIGFGEFYQNIGLFEHSLICFSNALNSELITDSQRKFIIGRFNGNI